MCGDWQGQRLPESRRDRGRRPSFFVNGCAPVHVAACWAAGKEQRGRRRHCSCGFPGAARNVAPFAFRGLCGSFSLSAFRLFASRLLGRRGVSVPAGRFQGSPAHAAAAPGGCIWERKWAYSVWCPWFGAGLSRGFGSSGAWRRCAFVCSCYVTLHILADTVAESGGSSKVLAFWRCVLCRAVCCRWRQYCVECTGSLPTSEVKRRRARFVLGGASPGKTSGSCQLLWAR